MFWRKVAIADGKSCYEGEVEGFVNPPTLYAPNCKPGSSHNREDPGQDWPHDTKLLNERDEEQAPHFASSLLVGIPTGTTFDLSAVQRQEGTEGRSGKHLGVLIGRQQALPTI